MGLWVPPHQGTWCPCVPVNQGVDHLPLPGDWLGVWHMPSGSYGVAGHGCPPFWTPLGALALPASCSHFPFSRGQSLTGDPGDNPELPEAGGGGR